jgi:hypothetical protein
MAESGGLTKFGHKFQLMNQKAFSPLAAVLFAMTILTCISCGSSRFYKDLKPYVSRENPPDVGSGDATAEDAPSHPDNPAVQTGIPSLQMETEQTIAGTTGPSIRQTEAMEPLRDAVAQELALARTEDRTVSDREILARAGKRLAAEQQGGALSGRQEKRIDKMARKMERRINAGGPDIDFRNNTPLELFFMIMSAAGLVLGIFGVGFGWFVFIVFGGIWLYYKLVVDKK